MCEFNRFDICEAHYLYARHYHSGGDTVARDFERLNRMRYKPGLSLQQHEKPELALTTENAIGIYYELVAAGRDVSKGGV
jgi:hypothetical protein